MTDHFNHLHEKNPRPPPQKVKSGSAHVSNLHISKPFGSDSTAAFDDDRDGDKIEVYFPGAEDAPYVLMAQHVYHQALAERIMQAPSALNVVSLRKSKGLYM